MKATENDDKHETDWLSHRLYAKEGPIDKNAKVSQTYRFEMVNWFFVPLYDKG